MNIREHPEEQARIIAYLGRGKMHTTVVEGMEQGAVADEVKKIVELGKLYSPPL